MKFLASIFGSNEKEISRFKALVQQINALEDEVTKLSQEELIQTTKSWQKEFKEKNDEEKKMFLAEILPRAFALVREASKRTLEKRHFDVQLMAGIALHEGKIAEQKTGEGKTLTATAPLYLNALSGDGAHLVTPNDYLSSHHAGWMGPVYDYLGLTVGAIVQEKAYVFDKDFDNPAFLDERSKKLREVSRAQAYRCDITYGTNHEFGFDYLRDNMALESAQIAQTNPNGDFGVHNFAVVDEVDSILIDVARTPLIISSPAEESAQKYYDIARLITTLQKDSDYDVDEKKRSTTLTDLGIRRVEKLLGVDNLYEKDFETVHHIEQALKAKALFQKDKDYVVKEGHVVIVDQFTGRLLPSNRYSEGLHQAIEAKEGVEIQRESKTNAEISYQNYFRMYKKLAGMTGTAETEAEEFHKIYGLEVVVIPTHRPNIRKDSSDVVYKSISGKFQAVANEIEERNKQGQPVLVGTTSVEISEILHELLQRKGIKHEILNAKNHEREALIISQAGRKGAVTVSTNMAGRGVDIILGGENPDKKEQEEVLALGGLHVIGTERHESRRIDNQLRGRSGRQGDAGSSRFYISLQDDLMRIFGGSTVERLMDRFGLDENVPLEAGLVSRAIENAQKRVEGHNFDIRKRVVEFDDVMNEQRKVIYKLRGKLLGIGGEQWTKEWLLAKLTPFVEEDLEALWDKNEKTTGEEAFRRVVTYISLQVLDTLWIEHLDDMDDVIEGINLRGYAQKDPLVEYRKEGHLKFGGLVEKIFSNIAQAVMNLLKVEAIDPATVGSARRTKALQYKHGELETGVAQEEREHRRFKVEPVSSGVGEVGRNDPCPCGRKKEDGTPVKYKNCGLINSPLHKA